MEDKGLEVWRLWFRYAHTRFPEREFHPRNFSPYRIASLGTDRRRTKDHAAGPNGIRTMTDAFREGIRLFNSGKFFDAHEALEAIWLHARGEEKIFLHGLIQIAAAFHHYTRGNPVGFGSLLKKGLDKLHNFGEARADIDLAGFLTQLHPWLEWQVGSQRVPAGGAPPLPRIQLAAPPQSAR